MAQPILNFAVVEVAKPNIGEFNRFLPFMTVEIVAKTPKQLYFFR